MDPKFKVILFVGFITVVMIFLIQINISERNASTGFLQKPVSNITTVRSANSTHQLTLNAEIKELGCRKIPDILIIGFEKCGTVALKKFLGIHPKVFITDSRINNRFFNADNNLSLAEFTKDMPCTPMGKLRLEKIATPGLPKLVNEYNPGVKLIAIVKEPVERALSHFVHLQSNGILESNARNFEEFVKESFKQENYESPVFHFSFYAERLQKWADVFPSDKILFLDGDNFVKDPVTELSKAELYLGIDASITRKDFYYSDEKLFFCIKALGDKGCMGRRKGRPHPPMQNDTRKLLQNFLKPYNEIFFKMIGDRFNWGY